MSADAITRIEWIRKHKFSEQESARLREIGNSLNLRDDDAVWGILAALEYQRIYYEALPEKIAGASKEVLQGITVAAEKETAAAQAKEQEIANNSENPGGGTAGGENKKTADVENAEKISFGKPAESAEAKDHYVL